MTQLTAQLRDASAIDGFDTHGLVAEKLPEAAHQNINLTLEILSGLLHSTDDPMRHYTLMEHTPEIIAVGLDAEGETAEEANQLLNWLGRKGNINIGEQVTARRRNARQPKT